MRPNPTWDPSSYEDAVEALSGDGLEFAVWAGDWCPDCRRQLPDFAAALQAAGVSEEQIEHCPVEKADDGSKTGTKVDEYGIELIPTVVVERDGQELTRFVETEQAPLVPYVADQIERS